MQQPARLLPLLLLTATLAAQAKSPPQLGGYDNNPKTPELYNKLRMDYGFSEPELQTVQTALAGAQRLPQLVEAEQKAPEKTETWTQYVRRIDEDRVQGGVRVIHDYADTFARAEAEYGVPAPVIAAILGVETRYGSLTGRTRVLDALATQGFEHPTRSPFFLGELAEFFAFCRDFNYLPTVPQGSYAGAMGDAQFMPSNYRRLAVDYDGDGRTDLWSIPDAIGSIAHYFVAYKPALAWQRGTPLVVRAQLRQAPPPELERNAKTPTRYATDMLAMGIVPQTPLPPLTSTGLIELPLDDGSKEYWLALPNFYTVMTYNPRTFYAMAVTQLAQRIEDALARQQQAQAAP